MTIHVAYAADANYGPYAGISIAWVVRRFRGHQPLGLHVHLLSDGIKHRDIERIKHVVSKAKGVLSVHDVRGWLRQDLKFLRRENKYNLTRTTYSKLFLADVLPPTVTRVIYLDSDTLVLGDIAELWHLTADMPLIAACRDSAVGHAAHLLNWKTEIGMEPDATYFNAGVLVVNLRAWRQRAIGRRLIEVAQQTQRGAIDLYDQDPLNLVCSAELTELPSCWNVQMFGSPTIGDDARVLHFTGKQKPWQFGYKGPGGELYRAVKRDSPWYYKIPEMAGLRRAIGRWKRSAKKRITRVRETHSAHGASNPGHANYHAPVIRTAQEIAALEADAFRAADFP